MFFFESRTSKLFCNFAPIVFFDIFILAIDVADSVLLIQTIASIGRLAEVPSPDLEIFKIGPCFELKFFSLLFL